ncbi:E3 ubiquitin-protein ligase TRIM7-like isoform X1, partial [Lates japonicus]
MASASSFLSEDQFLCSICLEVFTEPVSIPCGHNFCKACITRHWEGKDQCQCPLCNEKFNKGLKLRINTGFREVVENFKRHHQQISCVNNNSLLKPGQVPCDCCLSNKFKASKTCLVCLASYCETHLEPHLRVAALKRHKLTEPVHNLENKICKKHNRVLELFCRSDLTRVCVLCTEHSRHDTVLLEEEHVDKRAQIRKKKTEVQEPKRKSRKKAQKTKEAAQTKQKGKDEAIANSVVPDQMQAPPIWWCPNGGLHQFNEYSYVPDNRGFSEGRFYYEVDTKGRTSWDLGVVRGSTRGRRKFTPNPRSGNWIIRLENNDICRALHDDPVHLSLIRKPEKVLVFVDYESGLVTFFDADTTILIYSFTDCRFNERIFLFFRPSPAEDVSLVRRLQKKVQAMIMSADGLIYFIFMAFVLILSVQLANGVFLQE